jgi:hypothetical protein
MKRLVIILNVLSLLLAVQAPTASAKDNEDQGPPGLRKKGGVPPGLQKKGGVPPGQAKKQGKHVRREENRDTQENRGKDEAPSNPAPSQPASVEPAAQPAQPVPTPTPTQPNVTTPTVQPEKKVGRDRQRRRDKLDENLEALNGFAQTPEIRSRVLQRISNQRRISVARLEAQLRAHPDLGPGDIYVADIIAKGAKKPVDAVLAEHQAGKDWGRLANENKIDLPRLVEKTGALRSDAAQTARKTTRTRR